MKVSPYRSSREIAEYSQNQKIADQSSKNGNAAQTENIQNLQKAAGANGNGQISAVDSSDEIVSRQERDFFIKMFPQSSEQLEKHIVFNRNGKIQDGTFAKGFNIDAKI